MHKTIATVASAALLAHTTNALTARWEDTDAPPQAQVISQASFAALPKVLSQADWTSSTLFIPPGTNATSLQARPFHIYDDEFYAIIGDNPTLTLVASSPVDPLFHEAAVWYPPTDDVFFVQNAGAKDAGTGLDKSAIVEKISLKQVADVLASGKTNANSSFPITDLSGLVDVVTVPADPPVINPNGGTNWRGQIVFAGEGQGPDVPSALYVMNPVEPYNTTVLLNNYFGRQFTSLNDVAVHPSGWVYFTDVDYGPLQDFRIKPLQIRRQVYRFHPDTGVVEAITDHTVRPNGLTFSPDYKTLYVTDTGAAEGFYGMDWTKPASIYQFPVLDNGRVGPGTLFAYVPVGIPDGVHCDTNGNVYSGCGDGVYVWNKEGTLIGNIYTGGTSANFQFAGKGRMVILAETKLFYATFAAEGADITGLGESM